jgi:hypothetical protein
MLLVDDILMLPAKGFMGLMRKIAEIAEEEYTDESKVKEELMKLNMLFETDQLTETEHAKLETRLMKRLAEIRKYKKNL